MFRSMRQSSPWHGSVPGMVAVACIMAVACGAQAREIYVNCQTGNDSNAGTADAPLRSARRAVRFAREGDTIHLLPAKAVYREMLSLTDKKGITIQGHNCVISGADELPSDPAKWEKVADGLHRIRLRRTMEDRQILVVNGKAVTMGRTKYNIRDARAAGRSGGWEAERKTLMRQYPKPADLKDGQFAWEPIDTRFGWLYVKGPLEDLEWSVRTQGIATSGRVGNVTIRDLHARYALNDGWNFHGYAHDIKLYNVSGNGCFDNGISPHGACSFSVADGEFFHNELAVGNDFLTETEFLRCKIGLSTQEEVMFIGGRHVFEDCAIRSTGPVAMRLGYSKPGRGRPMALKEVEMSGKDINMKPEYTFRNCTVESADGKPHTVIIQPGVTVTFEKCTFKGMRFQADKAAKVKVIDCTLDGKALSELPGAGGAQKARRRRQ